MLDKTACSMTRRQGEIKGSTRKQDPTPGLLLQLNWTLDARVMVMIFMALILALLSGSQGYSCSSDSTTSHKKRDSWVHP